MSPTNNDEDKTNKDEFNEPIQYMNNFPNTNLITFTTGVYYKTNLLLTNIHIICL